MMEVFNESMLFCSTVFCQRILTKFFNLNFLLVLQIVCFGSYADE